MRKVALYGGSFDPFHICHQLVVPYTLSMANVDSVVIAPCHTHAHGKKLTPFEHRMNMVSLGANIYNSEKVIVSDIEKSIALERGKNLTLYTVEAFLPKYDTVVLILGTDIVKDLDKWESIDKLRELETAGRLEFFFINRDGHAIVADERVQMPSVSSTQIREMLKLNKPVDTLVPKNVLAYIKTHDLYH